MVVRYARLRGWLVYHPLVSIGSQAGYPDLTLARGSRLVFAELKRSAKEKLRPDQAAWRDALLAAGQEWHWWTPEWWDAICEVLA